MAFFNEEIGYKFKAKMKTKDGHGDTSIPNLLPSVLDASADDIELGKAVLETFEVCK